MIKLSKQLVTALIIALALVACGKKEETQSVSTAKPAAEAVKPSESVKPETNTAGTESTKPVVSSAGNDKAARGEKVYKTTCVMCHQTGVAGAPLFGDQDQWKPRIAQGTPILYEHAIKGFTGKKGMMPAKGANRSLSDEDVKAAVDYMVSKAK